MLYAHYEAVFIFYIYISYVGIKKVIVIVQFWSSSFNSVDGNKISWYQVVWVFIMNTFFSDSGLG